MASTIKSWKYAGYTWTFQELDYEDIERKIAQGALRKKKSEQSQFWPNFEDFIKRNKNNGCVTLGSSDCILHHPH